MNPDPVKPTLDADALPKTKGLYRRILVELSPNGTSGTVLAKCTGTVCAGLGYARIPVAEWRRPEGRQACGRCAGKISAVARTIEKGTRGKEPKRETS